MDTTKTIIMTPYHTPSSSNGYAVTYGMSAAGHKVAFCFQAPKSGTITNLGIRTATWTTANVTRVGIQGVSAANGDPDGNTSVFYDVNLAAANTWYSGLLTSDGTAGGTLLTVSKGDWMAVVMYWEAATPAEYVAGNFNIATYSVAALDSYFTYVDRYDGAAWAKGLRPPVMALQYSDGTYPYIPGTEVASTLNIITQNTGTNPDEIGLKFSLPAAFLLEGVVIDQTPAANSSYDVVLYDSDGNVVSSRSYDGDLHGATYVGGFNYISSDGSPVRLEKNETYTLSVLPTTANNIATQAFDFQSNAMLEQVGINPDWRYVSRVNGGAWTELSTRFPNMRLILNGVEGEDLSVLKEYATETTGSNPLARGNTLRIDNPGDISLSDETIWRFVGQSSSFTIRTSFGGTTSSNVIESDYDYIVIWIPPYDTYSVRAFQGGRYTNTIQVTGRRV